MIHPSPVVRIFLYDCVANLRRSFDGLCAFVTQSLGMETLNGDYFVLFNRN